MRTLWTDVPFSLAYRSIRSTIRQGSSTVKFCVGSAHSLAFMSFVITPSFDETNFFDIRIVNQGISWVSAR